MKRFATKFQAGHYQVLSTMIRSIEDEQKRKEYAEFFGKKFNERSNVFDYYQWTKACGV